MNHIIKLFLSITSFMAINASNSMSLMGLYQLEYPEIKNKVIKK